MAQLELSAEDRNQLATAVNATLENLEFAAGDPQGLADRGYGIDDINRTKAEFAALLDRLQSLQFNIRRCLVCGTDFEAANPRKQTCSDACRQALSRSKRHSDNSFIHSRIEATRHQRHSSTVPAGGHKETVTDPVSKAPEMDFVMGEWGTLPSNASRRQWIAIEVELNPELTQTKNCWPENQLDDQKLRTIAALNKEGVTIGIASNSDTAQVRFLMNAESVEPFTAGYPIPAIAIELAQKFVREVHP